MGEPKTLDAMTIALLDKSEPLRVVDSPINTTCVINGCPIAQYDWVVKIPGHGRACSNCADDHGWNVR